MSVLGPISNHLIQTVINNAERNRTLLEILERQGRITASRFGYDWSFDSPVQPMEIQSNRPFPESHRPGQPVRRIDMETLERRKVEEEIIGTIVDDILKAGYHVSVNSSFPMKDRESVLQMLWDGDREDTIYVVRGVCENVGMITLQYTGGIRNLIGQHTQNMNKYLQRAIKMIEAIKE